ncbi:MAG: DUF2723 domain-containing protein [Bacteroidaceae bacterium]|nr:DUF2723 domain-containing protein [Bacteroidaceae bacterium]
MKQFKIWNNALGWFTFLVAALTYCLTVEPTASFWDCPEFILSGNKLEIGHPPGAPFFMLTANFFSMFASPDKVAYMVNIMSAVLSAAGILFLFWSITHLTRKLLVGNSKEISKSQIITILASGLVGALAYTWSDTYWFSAVEGEVYGYSSLFTAAVFWMILKWEDSANSPHSDRWLVLIAYLVGLSIGVHLLNLLCLPAIVLVVYFKKFPNANFKGSLLALAVSAAIVMVVLYGIVPGVVKVGGWFELLFVNVLGLSFNTGLYFYILLLFITLVAGIYCTEKGKNQNVIAGIFTFAIALLGIPFYGNSVAGSITIGLIVLAVIYIICTRNRISYKGAETVKKYLISHRLFNTSFLCLLLIMIGYSSYALIVIRSSANTPMDQNSPEDIFTLGSYLNREQYGSRPLFYGECFDAEVDRDKNGEALSVNTSPIYMRVEKKNVTDPDEYEIIDYNKEYQFVQNMLFPRMYSSDHAGEYERWIGKNIKNTRKAKFPEIRKQQHKPLEVKVPTQLDNLSFFFNYQVNHMYWRYFLWNFVGRQNDIQNNYGEKEYGNWISGIPFVDNMRLGDQDKLPQSIKENKGRNVFFALPLILGIIGIVWQWTNSKKGKQQFWVVFMLFFMTGLAIVLYLNQTPMQPRERDYAYAGSFYAFAIWIGMSVAGITHYANKLLEKYNKKCNGILVSSIVALICLLVPLQMVSQTWDDHDRSGRYACPDFGENYLNTLPDEGCPIIFTCGDNDTFPLWYSQEVEGDRTDARVCNLSYLQTDWYTDQMKRPAYDSKSLPITWDRINYAGNTNIYVYVFPMEDFIMQYSKAFPKKFEEAFGKNPFEMNKITKHWILEANAQKKSDARKIVDEIIDLYEAAVNEGRSRMDYIDIPRNIIPCKKLYIPIDSAAVMRSGMIIPQEYELDMPEYMTIDISDKSVLYRHELILFDMLANAENWERPMYMSMTVGEKNYPSVLTKFFVHEGLAYRITPFDWSKLGYDTANGDHPVDIDRFCDNVINRFKWGGVKENKDYYADETIRRMICTHRNLVAQLATEMINSEVEDAKIISVLEKVYNELPSDIVPYDALRDNIIAIADVYNILYNVQLDYKNELEKTAGSEDFIRQAVLKELFLGNDTLDMLKQRRDEIANSILKNEIEHIIWYNTLKPYEINDIMLYHRTSLVGHAWQLLDKGKNSNIAREDITDALCTSFNTQVNTLDKVRSKQEGEIKRMVIGSIYQTLNDMNLSSTEMVKIERALRKLMKQSK